MRMSQHRPVLVALIAASIAAMLLVTVANAKPDNVLSSNPLVLRAFKDDGTWQGECWTWMKKLVEEATGKKVGFDYREGYFEAGGREVKATEALPGDIIQLADDRDTTPSADYPGLHTAIIYEVLGAGKFNVVDSNSQFDGMVRTRQYDPWAAAARYPNISVHIYRLTNYSEPPRDGTTPATLPAPVSVGDFATVNTPGDCLNLRSGAGLSYGQLSCLPNRTQVKVTNETITVAGRRWVGVTALGLSGWVAADYLDRSPVAGSGIGATKPAPAFRLFIAGVAGQ